MYNFNIEYRDTNFIGLSDFAKKRHTEASQFTHYHCSNSDLVNHIIQQLNKGEFSPGYREGVILVHIAESECPLFFTYQDFPIFEGMKISAECVKEPGREHEPPHISVKILEPKQRCKYVDIILYHKDVLAEDNDRTTDYEWEIVSINGRLNKEEPPMKPLTIVRNWLHLKGGTEMKGATSETVLKMLCDSILYENGIKQQ